MENQLFNWDEIEVGNYQLNHSENFFAQKHFSHERIEEFEFVDVKMNTENLEDKENIETATEGNEDASLVDRKVESCLAGHDVTLTEMQIESSDSTPQDIAPIKKEVLSPKENINVISAVHQNQLVDAVKHLDVTVAKKRPLNIACQWSTQKRVVPAQPAAATVAFVKPASIPPHAYAFKDVYQRKKEEALRKREEEERKMREFHSKPVPNFNAFHQQLGRRPAKHVITVPKTPQVLKKSRDIEEIRKVKEQELKRNNQQVVKFEPRPPIVLHEKPFIPKKLTTVLEVRPFNLMTDKRVMERKQFDLSIQRAMEEKKKQEEQERKKREEKQIKQIRKMATFKARPNPFK